MVNTIYNLSTYLGNNNPLWASLNNSVFVCLKCAGIHRGFGVNVSFIRSLTIDAWDDRQIDFLKRGGNKRFRDFLEEFKVPNNATMDFKYMIRASDYYRKLLKAEVYTEDPPFKPDIIAGLEMLEYGFNLYPSFDNSTPICSSLPTENKPKSFFNQVGSFLSKAKDQVKSTAEVVGSKINELEIGDKLKVTGEKTMHIAKATGNFVVEKGKEVYVRICFFEITNLFRNRSLFRILLIRLKKELMSSLIKLKRYWK